MSAAGLVLDTDALVGVDRADCGVAVLLARAAETGAVVAVPAPVLAQVIRSPARQARLVRLIRQPGTSVVHWITATPSRSAPCWRPAVPGMWWTRM